MVTTVLLIVHLFVTLALIGVVLIQRSEGGGLGIGSSQGMGGFMSGRGTANLLTRTTSILAAVFMALSLTLALMNRGTTVGGTGGSSILDVTPPASPAPAAAPATPAAPSPAPAVPAPAVPAPASSAAPAAAPAPSATPAAPATVPASPEPASAAAPAAAPTPAPATPAPAAPPAAPAAGSDATAPATPPAQH